MSAEVGAAGIRRVLTGEGVSHVEVRHSHFYGIARPVADPAALSVLVADARSQVSKARHVVYGWIGPAGSDSVRSSDDGEPHGTGGLVCLAALRQAGLTGAAVAVARVFGGTLLGAANLGRAYGEAARLAVAAAPAAVLRAMQEVEVRCSMADASRVFPRLEAAAWADGGEVTVLYETDDGGRGFGRSSEGGAGVTAVLRVAVRAEAAKQLAAEVRDAAHGRVVVRIEGTEEAMHRA